MNNNKVEVTQLSLDFNPRDCNSEKHQPGRVLSLVSFRQDKLNQVNTSLRKKVLSRVKHLGIPAA